MRLTDGALRSLTLPSGAAQAEIVDEGCRGLVLILGARSMAWQVRFSRHGKRHRWVVGKYPAMSLAEARALASAAMLSVDRGEDPRAPVISTVAEAWAGFWAMKAPTLKRPDHDLACWRNHLEAHIGTLPLDSLPPLTFDALQVKWAAAGLGAGQSRPLRLLTGLQGWLLDRDLIAQRFLPRRVVRPAGRALPVLPVAAVQELLAWCEGQGTDGPSWPFWRSMPTGRPWFRLCAGMRSGMTICLGPPTG